MEITDLLRMAIAVLAGAAVSILIFLPTSRRSVTPAGRREMNRARAEGRTARARLVSERYLGRDIMENGRAGTWRNEKWIAVYEYAVGGRTYRRSVVCREQPENERELCYSAKDPGKLINPAKLGKKVILMMAVPIAVAAAVFILLGRVM